MIYLLTVCIVILFMLVSWLVWRQGMRGMVWWFLVPFVLFNLGFSWHTVSELRGWPYHAVPHAESQMLYARVERPWIYFLVQQSGHEPRLYAVPYTPERAQQAQQAQSQAAQGQQIMIRGNRSTDSDEVVLYEFNHLDQYRKD